MRFRPRKRTAPDAIGLSSELSALRDCLHLAIAGDVGDLPERTVALIRKAIEHADGIAAAMQVHVEPLHPIVRLEGRTATSSAFILAGRQAATNARNPVSMLMLRRVDGPHGRGAPLHRLREVIDRQLRSTGDISRLLETENVIAVCLEADRPGALAALQRITKVLAAEQIVLTDYEYSLTELDADATGEGTVRRVGEGFQRLTIEPERGTPRRVLIVDDEQSVLNVMVEQLEGSGLGLEIEHTTSGYEACIRFGEFEPDLVMLDIRMPEIDGREALTTMRKASGGRDVKFMATSAMPEFFDEMRRLGCDECLVKPFDLDELVQKVAQLLDLEGRSAGVAA